VEKLWMARAFPVDESPAKINFEGRHSGTRSIGAVHLLSSAASLDRRVQLHTICGTPKRSQTQNPQRTVTAAVHRFEECIAGRVYLIEVAAVAKDRWRAYIVRIPGVPTALMPFYGPTPADAASLLCEWLTRAHARALNAAGTV
jgi:hypothetical protein